MWFDAFYIAILGQEHNSTGLLGEHTGEATDGRIDLFTGDGLTILAVVQPLLVDGVGNLISGHATIASH